ncbi:putative GTP pyrophosphokinase [Ruminiclostridium sufflavum DSM 19573]|uniref:Putative GTP pyrophosphokinase n=1 Tax=Ruminiclostridium sufflavum DSM 19573 TaxID=1121337 RepID=A0A318XHC5_9FIRM|nr:GTP pyrophosphokinase family protein [Ruminiclostridium sufflavum]PYG85829.1 putative GTP pyrophosphokinase [Ruminiclostridium sufflavum DSM 19573]
MIMKKVAPIKSLHGLDTLLSSEEIESIKVSFFEMQHLFQSATREISTKLEILDDEFKFIHRRNPIHNMQSRIKSIESIFEKLNRKGLEISIEAAKENLTDIAGIRVVCYYIDDIYKIAEMLKSQDDILLIRETDYIKAPKPNGYRSLHLVLKVPVFFSDRKEIVPVEIQIRTLAMDFWASLEHQLRYKTLEEVPLSVSKELQECAEKIAYTDLKMQEIYKTLMKYDCDSDLDLDLV